MWASLLAGLGGFFVMWGQGDDAWEVNGALDERTRFELTIFADILEFAYLRTSSMDTMIELSTYNEGYEFRELTRLWSGGCGECGCGDDPTEPALELRPPEWLSEMLPPERAPTHGILLRFSLLWPSRILVALPVAWWLIARDRTQRRLLRGSCPTCKYCLAGVHAVRCPECGDAHLLPAQQRGYANNAGVQQQGTEPIAARLTTMHLPSRGRIERAPEKTGQPRC
jgi:hypothetical protein